MITREITSSLPVIAIAAFAFVAVPRSGDMTLVINGTIYASYAVLAVSLALVWGYGGILSFGQASFFGIGGYVYSVAAINWNNTTSAALAAVAAAVFLAAMLGYFVFWGRLNDVYLGVITLTTSLLFYRFFNQTAGDEWTIGSAPLGGFNGIPSTPILTWPGLPDDPLAPERLFQFAILCLLGCYLICKFVLLTRFGKVVVATRENVTRAELLGYDTRLYKLGIFVISGGIAGLAGVLYANSVLVSPTMFSLQTNGQLIIWVIVGGLGTLAGPIGGCFLLMTLSTFLGGVGKGGWLVWLDPNLVMGVLLTAFVLAVPKGLLPLIKSFPFSELIGRLASSRKPFLGPLPRLERRDD